MKINSPAGKFIITFEKLEPMEGAIQVTGKFGAWDAKAIMTFSEFWGIVRMAMTFKMIGYMLKSMFSGGDSTTDKGT
jgi:hypothetical protein